MARLIPNTASAVGPMLAVHDNALWAVWRGWHSDESLYYSFTVFNDPAFWESTDWQAQKMFPDGVGSSTGPGIAQFEGAGFPALWAVWRGRGRNQGMFSAARHDTIDLPFALQSTDPLPGKGTSTGPTLAALGGLLYMAWKGIEGDPAIWYASTDDPHKGWSEQRVIAGTNTDCTPQLAATSAVVHLVWRDRATQALRWQRGTATSGFTDPLTVGPSGEDIISDAGFALAVDPDRPKILWLVYRGTGSADGLHWLSYDEDERVWRYGNGGQPLPLYPGNRLSVAFYHGHAYGAWMERKDQSIWWSQLPLTR